MTAIDPRLSINQATIKHADLATALRVTAEAGVQAIGLWREPVHEVGLDVAATMLADSGLSLPRRTAAVDSHDPRGPRPGAQAIDDNRRAIDETATLAAAGATGSKAILVLVVGGLPDGSRDLAGARERVRDALGEAGHRMPRPRCDARDRAADPTYVSDRAVVSTLGQALDIASDFDAAVVGATVDTFHCVRAPAGARADRARRPRVPHRDVPGAATGRPRSPRTRSSRDYPGDGGDRTSRRSRRRRGDGLRRRRRGRDLQRRRVGDAPRSSRWSGRPRGSGRRPPAPAGSGRGLSVASSAGGPGSPASARSADATGRRFPGQAGNRTQALDSA